ARQVKNSFQPYATSQGTKIYLLATGEQSAAQMFTAEQTKNTLRAWVLRFVGFLLMLFGIALCFQPIVALADVIPFFGDLVSGGLFVFGFVWPFFLSVCTIAVGWTTYRPLVGIPLLIGAAVGAYGLRRLVVRRDGNESTGRRRKRRRKGGRVDETQPAGQ